MIHDRANRAEEGASVLGRSMRRRGWSAPDVARRTSGAVSGSSVLAYVNGQTLPTAGRAIAVAQLFSHGERDEMLRAWGLADLADALHDHEPPQPIDVSTYSIEDSEVPAREVPLGWRTDIELVGQIDTSFGAEWIARTSSGTLLMVRPIWSVALAEEFLGQMSSGGDPPQED